MDKQLLWQILGYVFSVATYFILSWRYKGKEEATNEVRNEVVKQELAIQGKGLGELKKKAVQEFVSKLPGHLRIFINETTIEAVVKELQPVFQRIKEGKNGKE
nr:MAG TPA: holin [Caudoviricetes sp.]